jgi:class 3 adenylate cyclase/tetratricopeptide (TPR) repeat protein
MGGSGGDRALEVADAPPDDPDADLRAYVPRVQVEWLATRPDLRFASIDGTLVFADISGFTPLTERLSHQGRVGAERLTDVLNDVFGRLLGTAFAHGGDLLKFGGDALLLLFTGAHHEVRAASASAAMQAELRPFRRLRTEAGTVSLRMSVGAATGSIHGALVGDSHRELVVLGPVVSETAGLEAAASAGEVLLSPRTAASVSSTDLGPVRGGGVLLRGHPSAPHLVLEPPALPSADYGLGVPASIRSHLRGAGQDGEHRLTVTAFIQFKGTDDLLASDGLEVVADELHRLVVAAQEACASYGVAFMATDVDRNGGKVILAAGTPVATPDDEDRMLFALRDVVAGPSRLSVRAGVNRGHAFVVDMGAHDRRTYAVMGDVTNLAARVMGNAAPGQVLATTAVLDHVSTQFDLEPLPPFAVKGKTDLVSAAVVGAPVGRHLRTRPTALHGRAAELEVLQRSQRDAAEGTGRVVELQGEPGIGKSRLLAELVADGFLPAVVEVSAGVYASNSPYFALRAPVRRLLGVEPGDSDAVVEEALRRVVAERAPQLAPWVALLDVLVGLELEPSPEVAVLDPRFRSIRTQSVAAELLDVLLPGPTLLLVEDAQWLDDASGTLLGFVLNGLEARPWLVCVTRRYADGGFSAADREDTTLLPLTGIDDAAGDALVTDVAERAGGALAPHVRATLVARSGGNPLFLEELSASAVAGRDVDELPDTVEGLLAARVDVLDANDRQVLRRASVLGSRFSRDHLRAIGGLAEVELDEVVDRLQPFFVPSAAAGELEWRQSIVREIAYAGLPFRRRRELHAMAAELVEQTAAGDLVGWADLLSLHYTAAQDRPKAWHHARVAALQARANASPIDAAAFFTRAIDAARHLPDLDPTEVADVNEMLGEVAELGGRYDVAVAAYARARRLRRDHPVELAGLCVREGRLRERSGRAGEALGWFTRGRKVLDTAGVAGPAAEACRAELLLSYGGTRLRQGRLAASVPHLDEAARRADELGDRRLLAHAYYLLDWAHSELEHEEAAHYRSLALPIYEELGDHAGQANVLNNLGVTAYFEGRWDEALALYERSREERRRAGDLVEMGTAANNVGEIVSDQGHLDRADALFREALGIWRPAAFHVGVGLVTSNLGRAATRAGRFDEAEGLLAEAAERLAAVGVESLALEALAREVERRVLANADGALELVDEVVTRAVRLGGQGLLLAMVDRLAGCALLQQGDVDAGRQRLRSGLDRARQVGAPFEVALAQRVLARLDSDEAAAGEADAILKRLGVVSTPDIPLPTP